MAHIVIIGAGFAGLSVAHDLRATADESHAITLINESNHFCYSPSLNWFSIGWRDEEDICFSLPIELASEDINFLPLIVKAINAETQSLTLGDNSTIDYDYLVIATGAKISPSAVKHATFSSYILSLADAKSTLSNYLGLIEHKSGEIVILATGLTSNLISAYETVFIVEADLRRRKLRDKFTISLLTNESYIGELGLNAVGDSFKLLQAALLERDINTFHKISRSTQDDDFLHIESTDHIQTKFASPFIIEFPDRVGMCLAGGQAFCDELGFISVDDFQRTLSYKNIYAVGDCAALPKIANENGRFNNCPELMVESMVKAVTQNICNDLLGLAASVKFKHNAIGIIDMGEHAASFSAIPVAEPREVNFFEISKWLHLSKQNHEALNIEKLRTGSRLLKAKIVEVDKM